MIDDVVRKDFDNLCWRRVVRHLQQRKSVLPFLNELLIKCAVRVVVSSKRKMCYIEFGACHDFVSRVDLHAEIQIVEMKMSESRFVEGKFAPHFFGGEDKLSINGSDAEQAFFAVWSPNVCASSCVFINVFHAEKRGGAWRRGFPPFANKANARYTNCTNRRVVLNMRNKFRSPIFCRNYNVFVSEAQIWILGFLCAKIIDLAQPIARLAIIKNDKLMLTPYGLRKILNNLLLKLGRYTANDNR